jgi:hypothetical protein
MTARTCLTVTLPLHQFNQHGCCFRLPTRSRCSRVQQSAHNERQQGALAPLADLGLPELGLLFSGCAVAVFVTM